MGYRLRSLTIDDYDAILALWADSGLPCKPFGRDSREMMSKEMGMTHVAYFGIFDGKFMVATGIANYDGRRGWVNRVAVHPDHRGIGLAKQVIDECEAFLRAQGAVVLCALIDNANAPSRSTFNKAGYIHESNFGYYAKRDSDKS